MSHGFSEDGGVARNRKLELQDKSISNDRQQDLNSIASTFDDALLDVQEFTGVEFRLFPELVVTDDLDRENGSIPGGYDMLSHSVKLSSGLPQIDRNYARESTIDEEGDFMYSIMVEEATHALQNEHLNNVGIGAKARKLLSNRIPLMNSRLPDFAAEGFLAIIHQID